MSIGFAGRTVWTSRVSGNEVGANLWYHWLSSTKDLHRSERERTKITNCFSLARTIWLWRCRLPCLYFGEEILFEKKKTAFFRINFWIFCNWIVGPKSINFKCAGTSLIIIFKDFGRCRQHLGKYAVSSRIFQGISLYFSVQANLFRQVIQNLIAALSNGCRLQLLNFILTVQVYLVRVHKAFC